MPVMGTTGMDNDTRGWVLCFASGVACVLGASIICVDVLVRMLPGKGSFKIQDSDTFLACSLSLSFGVMIFMSLYSMLPEAKEQLEKGGYAAQPAGFILMACFIGGFIGIQAISRLFHQFLPSHVVDCDHTHDEHAIEAHAHGHSHSRLDSHAPSRRQSHAPSRRKSSHARARGRLTETETEQRDDAADGHVPATNDNGHCTESTPLLADGGSNEQSFFSSRAVDGARKSLAFLAPSVGSGSRSRTRAQERRRSSMIQIPRRVVSFMKNTKDNCDESGPCFGYSDPCGQECFKHISSRPSTASLGHSRAPTMLRTTTLPHFSDIERVDEVDDDSTDRSMSPTRTRRVSCAQVHDASNLAIRHSHEEGWQETAAGFDFAHSDDVESQHHHHVPENAFLAIGLQTSIAIALHKFPEGLITYATNHANPSLGFSVFLALFVHNISEGFALALPLYMALNSRLRAMAWASVLGGLSQPIGAGVAVLWFKLARHTHMTPDAITYGCLFGITAGIMASVALQLFVESLSLNHDRNLSILFAFMGMSLLGISNAFTSHTH